MLDPRPRHSPVQSFQFWFWMLMLLGGVAAWKLDLIQIRVGQSRLPKVTEEPMPPPPAPTRTADAALHRTAPPPQQTEDPETSSAHESSTVVETLAEAHESIEPMAFEGLVRTASVDDEINHEGVQFARRETAVPEQAETKSGTKANLDLVEVDRLLAAGEDVAAHRKLSQRYWQQPAQRTEIQSRLNSLADRIYFQSDVQYIDPYFVQFGDRLDTISRKYDVSGDYLSRLNGVEPQKLRAGQSLKVIQGPFCAVVDISDFEVTVHAHGYFVTKFPIGIGRDHTTPIGTFKVIDKVIDPEYYGASGVISHDDPSNPLGERWLAITDETGSLRSYGLHGTNDSNSVGKADSQGCIRLKDRDIVDLYDLLTIGSEVIIRE